MSPKPDPNCWPADEEPGAIDRIAADWLVRSERGLTMKEEADLAAWLEADAGNADAFAELNEGWDRLNLLKFARPAEPARSRRGRARRIVWACGIAATLALVTYGGWRNFPSGSFTRSVATGPGQGMSLTLPDGSRLEVRPSSALEIAFTADGRDLRLLRGEAIFNVAKDPSRPFVVIGGTVAVKAVGTAFEVHLLSDSVEVEVSEGRVRVEEAAKGNSFLATGAGRTAPLLVAGQRAVIADRPSARAISVVTAGDSQAAGADHRHRLEFFGVPLSEMAVEFNRYNPVKLVIADARLANQRFGGTFFAEDSEPLVRMLKSNFAVTAVHEDGRIVLRGSP